MKTLVAIPCFNEEKTIGSVVLKAKKYADTVIIVDDGSDDGTRHIAEAAGAIVIRHRKNFGYGRAIQSCFKYARDHDYDILTILDGDGQHNADDIPKLMKPILENGIDVTIGSRFIQKINHIPRYRKFGISIITILSNLGSKSHRFSDSQSGFRSYSRKAIKVLYPTDDDMGASTELLFQAKKKNLRFTEESITCSYEGETSTQKPLKHGLGVIGSIIRYMEINHSLLFFGLPGFLLTIIGFLLAIWVLIIYESEGAIPFGPSILTAILLIIGFLLGITGLILHAIINANNYFYRSRT